MKKIITIISFIIVMFACNKPNIEPEEQNKTVQESSITTPPNTNNSISELLFKSVLDDSLSFESDSVFNYYSNDPSGWGYFIQDNGFEVMIRTRNADSVQVGFYTNEYLISNTTFGIELTHSVYLGDGSIGNLGIGSSSTQINTLEITKVQNDSVWFNYDVDWHYKHWLYTNMNKSGTIVGEVNGFKYR